MREAATCSLVVIVNKAPPFSQESRAIGTPIYGRQAVLSTVGVLSLQKLHFDANVAPIDAAEVKSLGVDIEEVPMGGRRQERRRMMGEGKEGSRRRRGRR